MIRGIAPFLAALGLLATTGCQATLRGPSTEVPIPTESNAELVEYIGNLPYVTAEAVYRSVHILQHGRPYEGEYESLKQSLASEGLPVSDVGPLTLLNRAQVGKLMARVCDIRTGLNWRLSGMGRYAWRELQYHRIALTTGEYGYLGGGEYLGLLHRANMFIYERREADAARAQLGAEPGH